MKDVNLKFHWICHPLAEKLILEIQELALSKNTMIKDLENRIKDK